uniref:Ig-like domain-containing protein n=1 Tax=Sinocyclocheilus rhinocerous TaxID=307959 RepID=A0A673JLE0_9TELE
KAVNSETTFAQVTGSVAPSTTSIIWKHRDNAGTVVKVIEWDLEDGSTDIPNAKFKSHATLDKNTGNLNLKYLQLKHSGTYTVEINSKEQRKQFTLTVMEPVCKPHIVKKCVLEDVSGCLLICVGEASSESTVIWKYWDGEKLHEQYPNMRTITVTNSGNPDSHYTCTLKNAVSVETSDPVYLKYLFHEPFSQRFFKEPTFFHHKEPFVKQKGSSDVKGSLWNHLDKKVLLWHREAPLFLRVYLRLCVSLQTIINYFKTATLHLVAKEYRLM